jgi:DNA polymerase-3 subunit delta
VCRRAGGKGIRISPQVAGMLIRVVGNDVGDLDQELEKLSLLHPDASELTEAMVAEAVQGHRHFSVFAMVDALAQRDLRKALDVLQQQLEQAPREHVRLYMLVVQQFRRLLLISSMLESGKPQSDILKKLGLPGFIGKQAITHARQFKYAELTRVYALLGKMELRLKFEAELAGVLLREIFGNICQKTR